MLSHYTSELGLAGIARSQCLWATEFVSLNDKVEFVYPISAIYEEALGQTLHRIPDDLRDSAKRKEHIPTLIPQFVDALIKLVKDSDGYGSLYVVSFARGKNQDEDERGILTLWDRYTHNAGYCLQFKEESVVWILRHEQSERSYAYIGLEEVKYGIDRSDPEFEWLVSQFSLRLLEYMCHATGESRLAPDWDKMAVQSAFLERLMRYCGAHKDPAFVDEREVRIIAWPINAPMTLTSMARPKSINRIGNRPGGKRYIVVGEDGVPGFIPDQIIVGRETEHYARVLKGLYPGMPQIKKCTIPIR